MSGGLFARFAGALADGGVLATDPRLLIGAEGRISVHYAPFDHVNGRARIAIVGITPGAQQAANALQRCRERLLAGDPPEAALKAAKEFASFSGPMRSNLVAMLDALGVAPWLGIGTCAELWAGAAELAHFTSALRHPAFVEGKNYSGSPAISSSALLRRELGWFASEMKALPDVLWVPLGSKVEQVLEACGRTLPTPPAILGGLPHPSGANAERIGYFLGRKHRAALSRKTDPEAIDRSRRRAEATMRGLLPGGK